MTDIFFYKLFGAGLLILSAFEMSRGYSASLSEAYRYSADAERLVRYIGDAIFHRQLPINEIIRSYASENPELSHIYKKCAESSLSDVLLSDCVPYDKVTRSIMREFLRELGRSYSDEETELCRHTAKKLAEHNERLCAEIASKTKVFRALSVFSAASAVLLLI